MQYVVLQYSPYTCGDKGIHGIACGDKGVHGIEVGLLGSVPGLHKDSGNREMYSVISSGNSMYLSEHW